MSIRRIMSHGVIFEYVHTSGDRKNCINKKIDKNYRKLSLIKAGELKR